MKEQLMNIGRACIFALMTLSTGSILADQPLTYDRINLTVSSGREVENDTLVSVMYAQQEGNNPSRLANDVNRTIGNAVEKAKRNSQIKVQTLEYSTTPVYRKQTLVGWRVRQSLRLESRDGAALSELIGELQSSLAVGSISYTISPEGLKAAEDELIGEAITEFSARAQMLAREMGRQGYRLVQMDINTPDHVPQPRQMRGLAMAMQEDAAPPALEAGSRRVEVNINATIELNP
ncbi:MAG: SIMPL domain-containing protein [Chromatiaceae bacterium]|nr:SIMPL domain-containing protein [Chromatiaceae bacterium]MCP5444703.1 SIMPL domain-containing protein [Chromatiaceae bacterium]